MRSLFLSLAFLAAAGLGALTPGEASAQGGWAYYTRTNPGGYYAPPYYAPAYYTTSPYGGYTYAPIYSAPVVRSRYAPTYSAPTYILTPDESSFTPIYSGPQYFQGYAPNRLWIYP